LRSIPVHSGTENALVPNCVLNGALGEDGAVRRELRKRKRPDTWPLTPGAVVAWLVVVIALGIGTGLLLAFSFGWSEWVAIALVGAFAGIYQRVFWLVLRSVQRRAGR
jgi:hypothetical protein